MLTDIKQNELDIAEERLLNYVFGSTTPDSKTQWLLKFLDIDINKYIQDFENFMKPLMDDQGLVNAELTRSLVSSKHPMLANMVPNNNFRLVDVVEGVAQFIGAIQWKN